MWPFVISGLVVGAIYGMAAVGLVLTYKASGIFNFAQGAVATVSAYTFYELHVQHGVAWPVAAAVAVFAVGLVLGLLFEQLGRRLAGTGLAVQVTSTVGVLLIVQSTVVLVYGTTETRLVPVFLAHGQFELAGTIVQNADLITFVVAVVATAVLSLFFRFARLGRSMRALVDDPELLALTGTNNTAVRRWAWLIGVTFAGASGVLFCTVQPLDPTLLTLLVVQAFGAAAIGAFRNLPITFVGGLVVGVVASLATKWFTTGILQGLPAAFPFVVLFVVLLVFPRRFLAARARVVPRVRDGWRAPARLQGGLGLTLLAFFALVPTFAGIHQNDWTLALANLIVFLSLGLLVRESGQLSLGHVGFMAIGVSTFAHLADKGVPWVLALAAAMAIAVPIGALLAIPAIRLTGLYLALATLGFGILLQYMFYTQDFMFGFSGAGLEAPRPSGLGLGGDTGFYYLVLVLAVAFSLLVMALVRGRLGRLLRGVADSPTALSTSGTSVNVTRVLVFCVSAALAAVGGALGGMAQGSVTLLSYPPLQSLSYLALIMIVVGSSPWYAVLAAVGTTVIPSYVSGTETTYWLQLVFGVFAVLLALTPPSAQGTPPRLKQLLDRLGGRREGHHATPTVPTHAASDTVAASVEPGELELRDVIVRFGGTVAVDGFSLVAPTGRVTGLIGPNGAGKTTTFNVASGLQRAGRGDVLLDGRSVTRVQVDTRARKGIGRTFQKMELFDSLTVAENVAMGVEGVQAGRNPIRHLVAGRGNRPVVAAAVADALRTCGITALADEPVASLSTGQRRLVELARCLAGPFRILLLDEPSSGLDPGETARFGDVLETVVRERGIGILLVEHDMGLVMRVSSHIYVLDFGKPIFDGTPEQVRNSPVVQAAYLGVDDDLLTDEAMEAAQ
ncbi:amino acid/amide ABC transporter membrane protein 1, HAAT family /amino acid/amide ABC transporter membrane protein 2, HAAT family /amino acid/amide ABC transporter ATP-binding protein 1, HAAT family [Jatrophihabitans endophyticus]|uniref:Amino acid/amide ABC transporter membrane protein 1, HAAT family /amino acid/amide ABC transporter membrane protein 2, HAAT family /amino acid/amide ABC transporter ATP-binding protein 1, HAAT family n=1 Tax=Jatrophihabitans endophyticus TaxID=1206085 RepID=A0A1M5PY35_9ACTN|nr:ATP-binding cassette domain-containing protein [Jatrophihabitans endophyticus]SHH06441.1 amino acid/amide ABC transporter membrane protein 1, HAAT family /amino acid/amide ABC transporter membrane protein 2, HAAT family /amino acid/amide ABC transporter ATP-binding protein 1, HAAT family [Jatrophihabitans endophyticus]